MPGTIGYSRSPEKITQADTLLCAPGILACRTRSVNGACGNPLPSGGGGIARCPGGAIPCCGVSQHKDVVQVTIKLLRSVRTKTLSLESQPLWFVGLPGSDAVAVSPARPGILGSQVSRPRGPWVHTTSCGTRRAPESFGLQAGVSYSAPSGEKGCARICSAPSRGKRCLRHVCAPSRLHSGSRGMGAPSRVKCVSRDGYAPGGLWQP